jgi:predicted Zn-dependent protease
MEDAMSAAVAWELAPTPGRMPLRTVRPELRLVLPGERALVPVRVATRINRRGRLLVTLTVLAAVLSFGLMLATSVMASGPEIDHATTVSAGQTLSEVAAAQLPGLPINEGVARIQLANGLNTSQVQAGQSLLIPSMP